MLEKSPLVNSFKKLVWGSLQVSDWLFTSFSLDVFPFYSLPLPMLISHQFCLSFTIFMSPDGLQCPRSSVVPPVLSSAALSYVTGALCLPLEAMVPPCLSLTFLCSQLPVKISAFKGPESEREDQSRGAEGVSCLVFLWCCISQLN